MTVTVQDAPNHSNYLYTHWIKSSQEEWPGMRPYELGDVIS